MNFKLTYIFFVALILSPGNATCQLSKNWFNEDPAKDKFAGVSSDIAYEQLLKGKIPDTVIVAVIDGGTDVTHPDLVQNIWINPREIAGNGIDDDKNGYADDINGWSFIGDVQYDNLEATRILRKYKPLYEGKRTSGLTKEQLAKYKQYMVAKKQVETELKTAKMELAEYSKLKMQLDGLKLALGNNGFKAEDVIAYKSDDAEFNKLKTAIASAMSNGVPFDEIYDPIVEGYKIYDAELKYQLNTGYDSRKVVGDNYDDYTEKYYGNNNVTGPQPLHGTHVAGIIGAVRINNIGIKGVASNVKLMIVRVVPDGDERDKDVANAIRYAVDNGAKIINMSFGKAYSPGKIFVDEAVKYAASKDVLLVHASGNNGANIDKAANFPNAIYTSTGKREPSWIEVGAISSSGDAASFSNYGAERVDILAPGVKIYSTLPDSTYGKENGTSMAAPVVSGIAALIRGYYPQLTAAHVRQIIMDSAIKISTKTPLPGSKKKKVKYTKLCVSGGIANAYRALQIAAQYAR